MINVFDESGDGILQQDEFVTIETFRNKLIEMELEEKALASKAKMEAQIEFEKSKAMKEVLEQINDRSPTTSDKFLSMLPYLFPLLDGLQYGRFLLSDSSNPVAIPLAILYGLYRSVPYSGLAAYIALSVLSRNLSINRLIRFNMQQSIFLDIALFFPGIIISLNALLGSKIPTQAIQLFTDATFMALILTVGYCVVSSYLGKIPDKIPFISDTVKNRIPTVDTIYDSLIELKKKSDKDEET